MDDKITTRQDNTIYKLTSLPEGRTPIGARWVYSVKNDPDGQETFKARFVDNGFSQIKEIDYQETFAPTARVTSI